MMTANNKKHRRSCNAAPSSWTHQDIVEQLLGALKKDYQILEPNIEYRDNTGRVVGEIDLLGYKNGEFHLYEIKTGVSKEDFAKEQLMRAQEFLGLSNARMFYVHVLRGDTRLRGNIRISREPEHKTGRKATDYSLISHSSLFDSQRRYCVREVY